MGLESWLAVESTDAAGTLESLWEWLGREQRLRGRIRLVTEPPDKERMGTWADVVAVAVGGGGALTVLANSLTTWLKQPRGSDVRIKVVGPDGTRREVVAERVGVNDVEAVLRAALRPHTEE